MKNKYSLTIGWMYPKLMSTYGDQGNIIVLQKRCEWREIDVTIIAIDQMTTDAQLAQVDLLFGGGAQDREQEIVMEHLHKQKRAITKLIERDIPALFVCGAPQLFGNYYEPAEGKRIEGLGIFDMHTKHPGPKQDRLIGNLVATITSPEAIRTQTIVGFENHGGRTILGKNVAPFAKVIKGYGNNGEDATEGVVYRNAIGCYLHGPLLPKNPHTADYLIAKALEVKYATPIELEQLDDSLEQKAKYAIAKRLGIKV